MVFKFVFCCFLFFSLVANQVCVCFNACRSLCLRGRCNICCVLEGCWADCWTDSKDEQICLYPWSWIGRCFCPHHNIHRCYPQRCRILGFVYFFPNFVLFISYYLSTFYHIFLNCFFLCLQSQDAILKYNDDNLESIVRTSFEGATSASKGRKLGHRDNKVPCFCVLLSVFYLDEVLSIFYLYITFSFLSFLCSYSFQ